MERPHALYVSCPRGASQSLDGPADRHAADFVVFVVLMIVGMRWPSPPHAGFVSFVDAGMPLSIGVQRSRR